MWSAVLMEDVHPFPLAFSTWAVLQNKRDWKSNFTFHFVHFKAFFSILFQIIQTRLWLTICSEKKYSTLQWYFVLQSILMECNSLDGSQVSTIFVDVPCQGFWYVAAVGWVAREWDPTIASDIVHGVVTRGNAVLHRPDWTKIRWGGDSLSGCFLLQKSSFSSFFLGIFI